MTLKPFSVVRKASDVSGVQVVNTSHPVSYISIIVQFPQCLLTALRRIHGYTIWVTFMDVLGEVLAVEELPHPNNKRNELCSV